MMMLWKPHKCWLAGYAYFDWALGWLYLSPFLWFADNAAREYTKALLCRIQSACRKPSKYKLYQPTKHHFFLTLQPRAIFAKRYFITNVPRRIMLLFLRITNRRFLNLAAI